MFEMAYIFKFSLGPPKSLQIPVNEVETLLETISTTKSQVEDGTS